MKKELQIRNRESEKRAKVRVMRLAALTIALCGAFFALITAAPFPKATVPLNPDYYSEGLATPSGQTPTSADAETPDTIRQKVTAKVIKVVLALAGILAVYFIISNAWYLIIAAGSEEKLGQYKKGITWALIGLVLIILSYSIVRFIIDIPFQTADQRVVEQAR